LGVGDVVYPGEHSGYQWQGSKTTSPTPDASLRSTTLNFRYQEIGKVLNMDKKQHQHCFLSSHFVNLSWSKERQSDSSDASNVDVLGSNPATGIHSVCQGNLQPVPKSYQKCCVKFQTTPSVRTGFPAVIQHSLSEHLKCLKPKT
jgi:hypothetical protein